MIDALYIHVPFCVRKCPYCDFYSVPMNDEAANAYTTAIIRAIAQTPMRINLLDTLYFGGGTPTAIGGKRLAILVEEISQRFGISSGAEITVECNPHSSLGDTLQTMRAAGVNRLSFGMQSMNDQQLRTLGRAHSAVSTAKAVETARKVGFDHISLDLMLATPGQTNADIDNAVHFCADSGAEHVSAYLLKIEEGTPFAQDGTASVCPNEDGQADAYLYAVEALKALGYHQYEISNFARSGHVARHNLKYWDTKEYLGLGPSAHSFIEGQRFYFLRDLKSFCETEDIFSLCEYDGRGGDVMEYIMLRLRLSEGIIWQTLAARFPGFDPSMIQKKARTLTAHGLAVNDKTSLHLTTQGFLVSNSAIGFLLE